MYHHYPSVKCIPDDGKKVKLLICEKILLQNYKKCNLDTRYNTIINMTSCNTNIK